MTVSVVIPSYNYGDLIEEALASVLKQTQPPFEIIVVDDGSTDSTRQVLDKYQDSVRYIYQDNAGPSAARNTGIRASRGEYIAFLDSDDVWLPHKLERQMKVFERDAGTGMILSNLQLADSAGNPIWIDEFGDDWRGHVTDKVLLYPICPSTVIVKKSVLDTAGLFDENLRCSEDLDLFLRISLVCRLDVLPEVTLVRRFHGANITRDVAKYEQMFAGHLCVLERFFARCEEYRRLRNRAFAKVNFDYGTKYQENGSSIAALGKYLTCLWYDPRFIESYKRILRLLLLRQVFAVWSLVKKSARR